MSVIVTEPPNLPALVEAGREAEALELLRKPMSFAAATGPRSARAALEAATRLHGGDLTATVLWMSFHNFCLGASPRERAEKSDADLDRVLRLIAALEAWV
jgi:hypothetical protein